MKRVLSFLKPQTGRTAVQIFLKFTATLVELFLPWILEHIIDVVAPTGQKTQLVLWGGLMLLCALAAFFGAVIANRMAAKIAAEFTRSLRRTLFSRITRLPFRDVDRFTVPSLISRVSTDTYHVNDMIDRMLRLGIRAPILLLGGLLVCALMEPVLTLILLAALPLLGGLLVLISRRSIPLYAKAQEASENLVRRIQENMTGVRLIRALSKSGFETERFAETNRDVVRTEQKAEVTMAAANPLMTVFLNVGMAAVIVVGAFRVRAGATEPGKIIAFLNYFTILLNGLIGITRIFTICSKGIASGKRIEEVLNTPLAEPEIADAAPAPDAPHIAFSDVSFSYNKVAENLSHLSVTLERGQTLGIIGPTGSGKSTVLRLLLGFYRPDSGTVSIDGKPVSAYDEAELHQKFGAVFQNDFLYADEIRENIDFARAVTDADREEAIRVAQAGFWNDLPDGLDTVLSERGMNLSGGQRQRLLIARALAAKPEILLLDDCSSALDYQTDAAFRKALRQAFSGTTTVIVAQRVSSIRWADKILMLDEGRVLGCGTHEQLLASCEAYRAICREQMGVAA